MCNFCLIRPIATVPMNHGYQSVTVLHPVSADTNNHVSTQTQLHCTEIAKITYHIQLQHGNNVTETQCTEQQTLNTTDETTVGILTAVTDVTSSGELGF